MTDEFYDAFVSYARADAEFMAGLQKGLKDRGLKLFVDTESLPDAEPWRQEIELALDRSLVVVFLLSPSWVTSAQCRQELREAIARRKRLIPVRIARLTAEQRNAVAAELSIRNDIAAEAPLQPESLDRIVRKVQADPVWDNLRRRLLIRSEMWITSGHQDGLLLREESLEEAKKALERGKEPGVSERERFFIVRSAEVAAVEAARLEALRRASFARRAATVRTLLSSAPQTGLALAAEVWRMADIHETRRSLAEALVAYRRVHRHLSRPDCHVGTVRDLAFMEDDSLATVDDGAAELNDTRPGALCLWSVISGTLQERDTYGAGQCIVAPWRDALAVGTRNALIALRFYEDGERFGFRIRWELPANDISHLCYQSDTDLLAAVNGQQILIVRNGDGAFQELEAPEPVAAMAWAGTNSIALGGDTGVRLLSITDGSTSHFFPIERTRALAPAEEGILWLGVAEVALIKNASIVWRMPIRQFRNMARDVVSVPGGRILVAGGGANTGEPALVMHHPETGANEVLYAGFRVGFHRVVISPDGRWAAAAQCEEGEPSRTGVIPVFDLKSWCPLPWSKLAVEKVPSLVCAFAGGFATADGAKLVLRDDSGTPRASLELGVPIVALAVVAEPDLLVVAGGNGQIYTVDTSTGALRNTLPALLPEGEDLGVLVAVAEGTRLVLAAKSGRVLLLDARELRVVASAVRHQSELLGNLTELASSEIPPVRGAVAWPGRPWILLEPGGPFIGGHGWWDTRTDRIIWERASSRSAMDGAPPLAVLGGRLASRGEMAVVVYQVSAPGANDDAAPPELAVSVSHDMIDLPMVLLATPDAGLLVAQCQLQLLLFCPDEATPVVRFDVPEDFRTIAITGDGRRLIASTGGELMALSLDPTEWSMLALDKAGRALTPEERRRYLPETDAQADRAATKNSRA